MQKKPYRRKVNLTGKVSWVNWKAWEIEWLNDLNESSAESFVRRKFKEIGRVTPRGRLSGGTQNKINGWVTKKKEYWESMKKKILDENENELRSKYKVNPVQLQMNLKRIIDTTTLLLSKGIVYKTDKAGKPIKGEDGNYLIDKISISPKELKTLYSMIKTEKGEPDRIAQNQISITDERQRLKLLQDEVTKIIGERKNENDLSEL